MGGDGTDMFGCGTADKSWGETDSVKRSISKVDSAFEIMTKLGIEYFCFHDRDLSPEYGSLAETNAKLDEVTDYIAEKMKSDPSKKLLWGTAKCFDHPRYMHGAATSPSADVFAYTAAQVKKAVETTVKLGGKGYVFWGGREGYETLLNTNMRLELDNMARLMKMTVDYARSIGYIGDFYIEPKPKEPTKHQYDFDTATVLGFLRKYGLENDFKLRTLEAELKGYIATHTNGFTDEYRKKYERFEELQSKLDRAKAEYESAQARYKQIQNIIQTLKGDVLTEFDDSVWNAAIANVTVFHDGSMMFQFKDGTEIKE